jgi:predicted DCC family thiol-disulfide oxidoreductase YuxK
LPTLGVPFSYRTDTDIPGFDDSKPLFVFDGVCVLCSGGAAWLMRVDRRGQLRFTPAQSTLGRALYAHYGLEMDESYLLIDEGRAYTASQGYLRLFALLGGAWHLCRVVAFIPESWRDAFYAFIARHRYRWFGKADYCSLLTKAQRERLISS